ncbi:IS66 family insertion sequence element accessory protein TnpB [Companilactobacillus muriivasis]|uniref:IS66 family insertion sequence element accessory protein TnpB n=1 Tax=Companilactobacillus muriivasis TaxID=3081444 RepID=UPI0030C736DE
MLIDYTKVGHVYIVCGKTDLRRGIDGLAGIIQSQYQLDVYKDALFLFCGGRSDRFKMLYWDGDGFLLLYKRLENGKLHWPRHREEVKLLSQQRLRWLFEGLKIDQKPSVHGANAGSL